MEANVLYATGPNMEVLFNCKKEKYAFAYFQGGYDERERASMDYVFTADTLCISGYCELNCAYRIGIIELHVEGDRISANISQPFSIFNEEIATCVGYYSFDVRISGFSASTYHIYHGDNVPITLSSQGTDGIHASHPTHGGQATDIIYDAAGRRTAHPGKGVYIRQGRKTYSR